MATYSIAEVEKLTGIQAHTLRIWERRYDLVKAKRTDTKIRFYDDEQLKLLLNVSILLKHGYRVSKIDKMPMEEIHGITQNLLIEEKPSLEKDVKGLIMSMLSLDEQMFDKIFNQSCKRQGFEKTITDLIYPFLNQVGVLWGTNQAMPAQEHFVSNLIRKKIFSAIDVIEQPRPHAKKIILFLPEGDYHEIALLLTYYLAMSNGLRVYYLGQNVPAEDVILTDEIIDADYLMTIILIPRSEYESQVLEVHRRTKKEILISGALSQLNKLHGKVTTINAPSDFVKFLDRNQ